jgi:uncharacterized protein
MKWALLLITIFISQSSALAQDINFAHIATTGYGEISVAPDSASFYVQVEQTNLNAEQAKATVDTIVHKYIEKLLQLGETSEQISSSNLFLSPQYYYPNNGQPELIGYKAVRKVTVNVDDISLLNRYLDAALKEGVTSVNRIELKVKDREKYQLEATRAAITDAQKNAKALASGFNRQLGNVWEIRYQSQPQSTNVLRKMSLEQNGAFKDYQDTNIVIRDNVDVIYELN